LNRTFKKKKEKKMFFKFEEDEVREEGG